ncbi:hypothetical protein [Actinokineospora pegani]|uniref:hypothetical protein n=1 Tax=Actinokineospora pegani TaxID=2654637 RepID=UPI0012E9D95E|nr:hypothetical protein [Actinokineospora pegani]
MATWRRIVLWVGCVLLLGGLGVFFVLLGLERADRAASVTSAFVGIVGLGVAIAAYVANRRAPAQPRRDGGTTNSISGGEFHNDVIQTGSYVERDRSGGRRTHDREA